jgi:hypothetical protein
MIEESIAENKKPPLTLKEFVYRVAKEEDFRKYLSNPDGLKELYDVRDIDLDRIKTIDGIKLIEELESMKSTESLKLATTFTRGDHQYDSHYKHTKDDHTKDTHTKDF